MCVKLPYCNPRIDKCLASIIEKLNKLPNFKTLCCCCGHGKYNPTIVIKDKKGIIFELFSRVKLGPKKRNRYYKKDEQGYYYIPDLKTQKQNYLF